MIFHEVYGGYYGAVGRLIAAALSGPVTDAQALDIIDDAAFSESFLYITDAVKSGQWPVLYDQWQTPLHHPPQRPLTQLEWRWLATILTDRRMELFCSAWNDLDEATQESQRVQANWLAQMRERLADAEPLYRPEDFVVVDGVLRSDPYEDPTYRKNFRTVVLALREKRRIAVVFRSGKGKLCRGMYRPVKLEYSEKEDRFRLMAFQGRKSFTINLARILECMALPAERQDGFRNCGMRGGDAVRNVERSVQQEAAKGEVTGRNVVKGPALKAVADLELVDRRGALERAMVQFADLEKVTKQIDNHRYTIRLAYRKEDETEILIRILAFGPMVKIVGPESLLNQVKQRLERQSAINGQCSGCTKARSTSTV